MNNVGVIRHSFQTLPLTFDPHLQKLGEMRLGLPRHARTLYGTWGDCLEIDNLFFITADKRLVPVKA